MSRNKKFHNLIEQGEREEKKRVWEKIQQNAPRPQPKPKKEVGFIFSRKFITVTASILLVVALGILSLQFIPKHPSVGPSDDAQGGISGTQSSQENLEESEGAVSNDSDFGDNAVTSGSEVVEEDIYPEGPSEGEKPIQITHAKDSYVLSQSQQTFSSQNLLHFDWYDVGDIQNQIYIENATGKELCYQESYINCTQEGYDFTLWATQEDIVLEEFFAYEQMTSPHNINGVQIFHFADEQLGQAYARFVYQGNKYYLRLEGSASIPILNRYLSVLLG